MYRCKAPKGIQVVMACQQPSAQLFPDVRSTHTDSACLPLSLSLALSVSLSLWTTYPIVVGQDGCSGFVGQ